MKTEIWNNAPPEFVGDGCSKNGKMNPAVVIATRLDYELIKSKVEKYIPHHRIKLLDKAAVKEFSGIII